MNANSQNVFMNGVTKDGEGFLLFITDYGIGIGEVQGVGSGEGGLDLKQVLMINVDRMFNENNLEIFEVEVVALQKHCHHSFNEHCVLRSTIVTTTLCCHLLSTCHVKVLSICY